MRGTRRRPRMEIAIRRFIPAHAGNADAPVSRGASRAVHPRACGERGILIFVDRQRGGSSPRMRGTPADLDPIGYLTRFIPAHAGNASVVRVRSVWRAVHPRACGERVKPWRSAQASVGSSPRMRGTRPPADLRGLPTRFIPAHAGNAAQPSESSTGVSVHPRACGERSLVIGTCAYGGGSSPRMRGTPMFWRLEA